VRTGKKPQNHPLTLSAPLRNNLDEGHGFSPAKNDGVDEGFRICVRTKEKPQISPLRFAPVEMTNLLSYVRPCIDWKNHNLPKTNLSSRPERIRISCHAPLATPTYAAFCRERRMKSANATKLNRKSGGAERRDLRFIFSSHAGSEARTYRERKTYFGAKALIRPSPVRHG
jgi:hypothetical protein